MKRFIDVSENIRPIFAAVRSVPVPPRPFGQEPQDIRPFITISRQPGSGAWTMARDFVEVMNAEAPDAPAWTCWDRELVEKVAADHKLSQRLIDSLQESDHSWLTDFLRSLSFAGNPDDAAVYHRVASTVTALARAGNVVLVGRGAAMVT